MRKAFAGAWIGLMTTPILAGQPDRFAYTFELTPEEGPVDPEVQERYSAAFDVCQKRAVSTAANLACFGDEFVRQDAALNRAWRTTLRRYDSNARRELLAAQRRWIADRDPFCRAQAAKFDGGTIAPVIYANCRVEATIRRTLWLELLAGGRIPPSMRGTWARHGRCDLLAERLTITAETAGWGRGPFRRVDYDSKFKAIFWTEEGVVDNFVMGRSANVLVHNTQGFHMPGQVGYARCSARLKRLAWPPG